MNPAIDKRGNTIPRDERVPHKMVYCDSRIDGSLPLGNRNHPDVHYMIIPEDADIPVGFRDSIETLAAPKVAKKKTKKVAE